MEMYEMLLGDGDEFMGVEALSLVKSPAIQSDWIALSDVKPVLLAAVSEDKRILMGAALIPDKPILRKKDGKDFYIYFSKDTIEKTAQGFFKNANQNNATLEHEIKLSGMSVFESWIVEDPKMDKSAKHGLNVPAGTWMVSMKVDDEQIWNDYVKNDKVFGFSIEGRFANKLVSDVAMSAVTPEDEFLGLTLDMVKHFIEENI